MAFLLPSFLRPLSESQNGHRLSTHTPNLTPMEQVFRTSLCLKAHQSISKLPWMGREASSPIPLSAVEEQKSRNLPPILPLDPT